MPSRTTRTFALTVAAALLALSLTSCSSGPTASASKPVSLDGSWKQDNSHSSDSYQAATIKGGTITIDWVTDNGDTKSLYWAGTFTDSAKSNSFTFTSKNDKSKTQDALLASTDPTKKFTYNNGEISYSVSALGSTTTVKIKQK